MAPPDNVLEDEPHDRPGDVVDGRGGWDVGGSGEDDGEVDVFEEGVGPAAGDRVRASGEGGADEEKEDEPVVDLTLRELQSGSNDTPLACTLVSIELEEKKVCKITHDDRRGPKHLRRRANEAILLMRHADVFNVREHPCLHTELRRPREHRRDHLAPEHRARRDLHVVAEFEVRDELDGLEHGDVSPRLEQHHRDGSAREHVPDDELGDDVEPNLLVRDSLDHAYGDHVGEG